MDTSSVPGLELIQIADAVAREKSIDRDEVIVVEHDELPELQVARQGGGFRGDTFLKATVTANDVGVVVEEGEALLVVLLGQVSFGDGHTDGVGDTLTKRAGADLSQYNQMKEQYE